MRKPERENGSMELTSGKGCFYFLVLQSIFFPIEKWYQILKLFKLTILP